MVEDPYTTYPAAICLLPGCKTQASGLSPDTSSGFLRIEKVVPTLTFTSILDDPSSGSKTTAYLASFEP